ncbi:hypothetical protein ACEU9L_004837, partial [Salmonella enterica]
DVSGAEATGNLSFLGSVSNGTCIVSGHNIAHDLGEVSIDDVTALANWGHLNDFNDVIHVTGCPSSVTKVKIKPTATELSSTWGTYGWVKNGGTAKGVAAHITAPDKSNWDLKVTKVVNITKGGVTSIPIVHTVARVGTGEVPDVGTLDFKIQYSFEFE